MYTYLSTFPAAVKELAKEALVEGDPRHSPPSPVLQDMTDGGEAGVCFS